MGDGKREGKYNNKSLLNKYKILSSKLNRVHDSAILHYHLGETCIGLGYQNEAISHFKKALKLDPYNSDLINRIKGYFSQAELENILLIIHRRPFWKDIRSVLLYPIAKQGKYIIFTGAIFFTLLNIVPIVGSSILLIPIYTYILAYMHKIINCTVAGEKEMPSWPDISDFWDSIIIPAFSLLSAFALSFSLFILLNAFQALSILAVPKVFLIIGLSIGIIYGPISLIAAAIFKNPLSPLNFPFLIKSILKLKKDYLFAIIAMSLIAILMSQISRILELPVIIMDKLIFWICILYLISVQMYILGNLYYVNEHELKWF